MAETDTELSWSRWLRLQVESGRRDRIGNFARWALSRRQTPHPPGYREALAQYERWFAEQSRSPAVRQVTDRLAVEAARPPSRAFAAPITGDDVLPAIVDILWAVSELLDALVLTASVERQPRLRSVARSIDQRVLALKAGLSREDPSPA